jgi:hypothetical protein
LLWLGIPRLCWIGVVRMDTLVIFVTLEEMASVFPHLWCMMSAIGLSYIACSFLFFLVSSELLLRRDVEFYQKFFCIYWDNHVVLSLLILICYITFNGLCMLNHPCIPQMKLSWLWCMIFLICC